MAADEERSAPGWEAIDQACARLYLGQQPKHFGTIIKWSLGGRDPLDGVSMYWAPAPRPHWHYVSYGLTDLYEKSSSDSDASGFGFELTFRLGAADRAADPPLWPVNLMQNLARYVFQSGNAFDQGHHLDANGPIAIGKATRLTFVSFARDPELGALATPHGRMQFLQIVPFTPDEGAAAKDWNTEAVQALIARRYPKWVTDLDRASLLDDPAFAAEVRAGSERDGSSEGATFVSELAAHAGAGVLEVEIGAIAVPELLRGLRRRLPYDAPFTLIGPESALELRPGESDSVGLSAHGAQVSLTRASVEALAARLAPVRGRYELPGLRLRILVKPTEVRDQRGEVLRVIG
jgi:hypothetical protein